VPLAQVGAVPLVVIPLVQLDGWWDWNTSSPIPSPSTQATAGNTPKGKFSSRNRFESLGELGTDITFDKADNFTEAPMEAAVDSGGVFN